MARIRRGYVARRCRTKICLFASSSRGAHSRFTRTITQQKIRAFSAHRDRGGQKINFRRLWSTRTNAVIRDIRGYKKQLLLSRKILAQIAVSNRN